MEAIFNLDSGSVSVGSVVLTGGTSTVRPDADAVLDMSQAPGSGSLTISGATPITTANDFTLNLNGASSTVNYSGSVQAVTATAYRNLTLSGSGAKSFSSGTTVAANLSISSGVTATLANGSNTTANALSLGGTTKASGTWGSTSSAATHKNATFFPTANTGIITVATGPASATSLISAANPSTYGDTVLFTATVTGSGPTPTGTVTFKDGAATLGTGAVDGSGHATYTTTATQFSATTHSITAVYGGDDNYGSSTSAAVSQVVNKKTLTAALTGTVSKVYNATTAATLAAGNYSLPGVLGGDTVNLNNPTSGSYDTKNVGTGKTVAVTGLSISGSSAGNYQLSGTSASGAVGTITAKALTVSATGVNKVYDGTTTATVTLSDNRVAGDVLTTNYTSASFADKNAGNGKTVSVSGITVTGTDSGNYTFNTSASATANITPASLTITADAQTKVYGSVDPALTFVATGLISPDTTSGVLTRVAGESVGSYAISQGTLTAGSNYTINFTGANLSITKATLTVTPNSGQSKVYGASDPTLTYGANGFQFSDNAASVLTGALSRASGENVGNYGITQNTLAANGNYIISFTTGVQFAITEKNINVTANPQTKVYGQADPTLTYTNDPLVGSDSFTGSLHRASGESVNTYAIDQDTLTAGSNYTISFTGANLTITKATLTVTADSGQSKVYGAADSTFTYQVTGLQNGDSAGSVLSGALSRTTGEPVGSYGITQGSLVANGNYSITFVPANFNITTATLILTPDSSQSKVYGASEPSLTYQATGFKFTDNAGTVLTGSLSRANGESVGNYPISQGTLAANSNYTISFVPGVNFAITPADLTVTADNKSKTYGDPDPALTYQITSGSLVGSDTISGSLARDAGEAVAPYSITKGSLDAGSNYNLTFVPGTLTIGTREVTVTADPQIKVYGDSDPALIYKITSGTLAFSDAFTGSLDRDAGEDVGAHAITQGTLDLNSNYVLTYVGDNLTITPKAVEVTADAGQTKVYGDPNPAAYTYHITSGGLVGSDAFTGALTRESGENIGSYAIGQGTLALSGNYSLTFVPGNFAITVKTVNVTADPKSKTYGEADPAFTYTNDPLVAGDSFSGSLSRDSGEGVGDHAITLGTLALNSNYNLVYHGANLTIGVKTINVKATDNGKTYGGLDPVLAYTSDPLSFTDSFTGNVSREAGESVGTYAIGQGDLTLSANYSLVFTPGTFTISKKIASVTPDAQTKVYGTADPALTGTLSGFLPADGVTATYSRTSGDIVGSYTISAVLDPVGVLGNYDITYNTADFTITPAHISVTPDDKSKTYGDTFSAFTGTVSGVVAGDNITAGYDSAGASAAAAVTGSPYDITASLNDPDGKLANYDAPTLNIGHLTVNAKALDITANDSSKIYGDTITPAGTEFLASGLAGADAVTSVTLTSSGYAPGAAVGPYDIIPSVAVGTGLSNYTITYHKGTLTVNQADLTVTADNQSRAFGVANPTLTGNITGLKNGDPVTATYSTTATPASPVGNYDIVPATVGDTSNYNVNLINGTLNVTIADQHITVDTSAAAAAVYNTHFDVTAHSDSTLDVSILASGVCSGSGTNTATVTMNSGTGTCTVTYSQAGDTNHNTATPVVETTSAQKADQKLSFTTPPPAGAPFNGTFSVVAVSDSGLPVTYGSAAPLSNVDGLYTMNSGTGSGTVTVDQGGNDNYNPAPQLTALVSASKINQSIDFTKPADATYGDPSFGLTATGGASGNPVTFVVKSGPATVLGSTVTITGAGTVTITASQVGDANYNPADDVDQSFNVAKATLHATADNQTINFGDPDPAFTVSYTGFVNGENKTAIDTPATASVAGAHTAPGVYDIVPSGALDNNYDFTYANGTLTVVDAVAPVVTVPSDITQEATGASGAAVNFTVTANDNVDGSLTAICDHNSGDTFSIGTTVVNCSATDSSKNTGSNHFSVTVEDTTGPAFTAPSDISIEATGPSTTVTYSTPSATDAVDGTDPVVCTPASGTGFSVGTTTVSCSSTDAAHNVTTHGFNVIVTDTTGPAITTPTVPDTEAASASGAVVTYTEPSATDAVDATDAVTCDKHSGDTFAIGTTTVHCSSTDTNSNTSNASFTVKVKDSTAPVIDTHAPITVESPTATPVTFTPPLSHDAVDGDLPSVCVPASGSTFPLGTTPVTCSKTDAHGNVADPAIFNVTVQDTTAPVAPVIDTTPPVVASSTTFSFTFHGPADAVSFACKLDSDFYQDCSTGSFSGTTNEAAHTFYVTATDASNNTSTPATFTWTVDTTGPTVTIDSGPSGTVASADATFTFHSSDSGATFMCSLDGADASACASPKSYTSLPDGPHTFSVYGVDAVGNQGTAVEADWTVNTAPPANNNPTTNAATGISSTDATLNGLNGDGDAGAESFWVSLNTFDVSTPNIPAGVYSTPVLPGVSAHAAFTDPVSIVSTQGIITGGASGNLAITPNTTYYYVAWANVGGTWYHGEIQSFTTLAAVGPVITNQSATAPTDTSITVNWTTDHPATSRVVYGTSSVTDASSTAAGTSNWGYPNTTIEDPTLTLNHSVVVTGLSSGTTYFFRGVSHGSPETASPEVSDTTTTPAPTTGTLEVKKVIVGNANAVPQQFSFVVTSAAGPGSAIPFDPSGTTDISVAVGTFSVAEVADANYDTTYDNCSNIQVTDNATTICTITNTFKQTPPPPTTVSVHIFKYVDGVLATAANANSSAFPMLTTFNSSNIGSAVNAPFTLSPTGWGSGDAAYEASFSNSNPGADYATNEVTTGNNVVGATCDAGQPFALVGYSTGATLADAQAATPTTEAPAFTNLQTDEYVIVWNHACGTVTPPSQIKVHIQKYLDGALATAVSANSYQFPMTATWQTANLNGGVSTSGNYVLGNNHGGAPDQYGADTSPMDTPADYTTSEITNDIDNTSQVLPVSAQCVVGDYHLLGYKTSAVSFADAATQSLTTTAPVFTGLTADQYIIVANETCQQQQPQTGTIIIQKHTGNSDDNGTFTFTGLDNASITTVDGDGSQEFDGLPTGSYAIAENAQDGWTQEGATCTNGSDETPIDPSSITLDAGDVITCVFTNTKTVTPPPQTGKLVVVKIAIGGNGTFNFTGDLSEFAMSTHSHIASKVFKDVPVGTVSITETPQDGWTQTRSTCDSVSITPDHTAFCFVVNKKVTPPPPQKGSLKVIKQTVGGDGTFSFSGDLGSFSISTDDHSGSKTFNNLNVGSYSVTENTPSGWTMSSNTCANVAVTANNTATCTITNTKNVAATGKLKVIKKTIGGNGLFSFSGDAGNFHILTWFGSGSKTISHLPAGSYSVSENAKTGWTTTSNTCQNVSVTANHTTTCVIVNTKGQQHGDGDGDDTNNPPQTGSIVVKKVTSPTGDATVFNFSASYDADGFTLTDGDSNTADGLEPGTYNVSEAATEGWTQTSAICDHDQTPGNISLAGGETVTCTFTNTKQDQGNNDNGNQNANQPAHLSVIKHVVNNDGGTKSASDFTMTVTGTNVSASSFAGAEDPGVTVSLDAGTYSVAEGDHTGYTSSPSADCSGSIAAGESKTCTITNDDIAQQNNNPAPAVTTTGGGGGGGTAFIDFSKNSGGSGNGQVLGASTVAGAHPDGTLILSGQTIFLIKNGQRYGFRDPNEYKSYGYKFSQTVPANAADMLLTFDPGNILKAMAGTLVLDSTDHHTVYMIGTGSTKRGFSSLSVFTGLGYSLSNILSINVSDYPTGPVINSSTDAHPDGSLVLSAGTVWGVGGGQRQGFESLAVFNSYGFSFSRVVAANAADVALPVAPLAKFRDGTLVLDGGTYYIISDSVARPFSSQSALIGFGYSASNVVNASLASYAKGAQVQ